MYLGYSYNLGGLVLVLEEGQARVARLVLHHPGPAGRDIHIIGSLTFILPLTSVVASRLNGREVTST